MNISTKSRYGVRAMIYLADIFGENKFTPLKEIAQKEEIPFDYLEKIISQLRKSGLIKSKKGIQGGYSLARSPEKINVGEIIKILEKTFAPVKCVAKEKEERYNCPRKKICKSFFVWGKIQDILNSTLKSVTLADLIDRGKIQ